MYSKMLMVFCKDRAPFDKLVPHIQADHLEIFESILLKQIAEFYDNDSEAKAVDLEWLEHTLTSKYPKKKSIIQNFVSDVPKVSVKNTTKAFINIRKEDIGLRLAEALHSNVDRDIEKSLEEYQTVRNLDDIDSTPILNSVDSLTEAFQDIAEPHFKLRPKSLGKFVGGGVYRGSTTLFYARPNVGKTLIATNNAAGWALDGHRVLYICNEEPEKFIMARIVARLVHVDARDVPKRWQDLIPKAVKRGINNIFCMHINPCTPRAIEAKIKKVKPDIVIIDQLRKVMIHDDMTIRLEKASEWARTMASKYDCAMVEVTQAATSAANRLILKMEDVADCGTGIQGNLDLMVGIGSNHSTFLDNTRMINVTKNKWKNAEDHWMVRVEEKYSKMVDIDD